MVLTSEEYEDGVLSVYLLKDRLVQEEWLLIVRVNKENKVTDVQWMYVSAIEEIDKKQSKSYKDGYRYVAIQLKDHPTEDHPFEIDVKFKKALSTSLSSKSLNTVNSGDVKAPPIALLKRMYDNFPSEES